MNHKRIEINGFEYDTIPDYLMLVEQKRAEFLKI